MISRGARRFRNILPSLHSPLHATGPQPTLTTGISATTAEVPELMGAQ